MDTLQEILKSLSKQNQSIQTGFGLNSFQSIAESIRKSQNSINLTGLGAITDIAKSISRQMEPYQKLTPLMGVSGSIKAALAAQKSININNYALRGLTSSLSDIFKHNQELSDKLAGFASSQILLSNSLSEVAKSISNSHLNNFNSLNIALQGLSNSYLREIAKTRQWEGLEFVEEANETIASISDKLTANSEKITSKDLEDLRSSIISHLTELLSKSKIERIKLFIFDLIITIGFLLTLYGTYQSSIDKTNQDVIDRTIEEIGKVKKELTDKFDFELKKLHKTRVAQTNMNLRYSYNKRSKILGLVKKGQQVTVIEIRHKWLLVSYLDNETGEPKSGFVFKKYFKLEE